MFSLFGIKVANLSLAEATEAVLKLAESGGKHLVVTANPEIMVEAKRNQAYARVLAKASLVLPDGAGVVLASYFMGNPLSKGRVSGTDLVESILSKSGNKGLRLFIAGSTQAILDKTTHYFASKYTNIAPIGSYSAAANFKDISVIDHTQEGSELARRVNEFKPNILMLAFGHPRQELWLEENINKLEVNVGIGVGGSFEFISGTISRAPKLVRMLYLEWVWRLILQPWRLRRILTALVVFPAYVLNEWFKYMFHVEQS